MEPPCTKSGEIVDLALAGCDIVDAQASAIIRTDYFETVRLPLPAGLKLSEHGVGGDISLHCLDGRVELVVDSSSVELRPNQLVYLLDGAAHSVTAIEDSLLLMTVFFHQFNAKPQWAVTK